MENILLYVKKNIYFIINILLIILIIIYFIILSYVLKKTYNYFENKTNILKDSIINLKKYSINKKKNDKKRSKMKKNILK